ncbi:MAG TPA: hypothetical protein VFD18_09070, partial [Chthoniobacterales bacterium]|nr:hypothetical protein [Chthoniobacterales bacterium]
NEPLSVFEDMFITRSSTLEGLSSQLIWLTSTFPEFRKRGMGLLEYAMPGMKNNSDRVCSRDSERQCARRIKA